MDSLSPAPGSKSSSDDRDFERWIREAHGGSRTALGNLLEQCRNYLLLIANRSLDDRLRTKIGASDLVQETFVDAQRDFGQFRGRSEQEFYGWLVGIMAHRLANTVRHYRKTKGRDVDRELPPDSVTAALNALRDEALTPCAAVLKQDEQRRVRLALEQLPDPWRSVIVERTWLGKPFAEIAASRNCSVDAARKTWLRAVQRLRRLIADIE